MDSQEEIRNRQQILDSFPENFTLNNLKQYKDLCTSSSNFLEALYSKLAQNEKMFNLRLAQMMSEIERNALADF